MFKLSSLLPSFWRSEASFKRKATKIQDSMPGMYYHRSTPTGLVTWWSMRPLLYRQVLKHARAMDNHSPTKVLLAALPDKIWSRSLDSIVFVDKKKTTSFLIQPPFKTLHHRTCQTTSTTTFLSTRYYPHTITVLSFTFHLRQTVPRWKVSL